MPVMAKQWDPGRMEETGDPGTRSRARRNGECSAVVTARSMGWGWAARHEAAGKGRARSSRARGPC